MSRTKWTLSLTVFAGLLAGALAPHAVTATPISVELRVYGGGTSMLTCGWHGVCGGSPTAGNALDWDNGDEANVYWRSYGYRSDTTGDIAEGATSHYSSGSGCNVIGVTVEDAFGFEKGLAEYVHTSAWLTGTFDVEGSTSWSWTESLIGFSVTSEAGGCSFGGSHVHQINGANYWTRRSQSGTSPNCSGYYPNYTCQNYTKSSYLSLSKWQFKQAWCWFC